MVVGGGGFIGSLLVRRLLDRGYNVTVVDNFWFGNYLPKNGRLTVKELDALELKPKDVEKVNSIIFIAGVSNDPMAEFSPQVNFVENSAVPSYLAYILKQESSYHKQKRFVYASSCSVYGYTKNKLMDETAKVAPQFPYGISKLLGEKGVMDQESEYFRPIALRKGTVGGWSNRMRFDLVVNTMTKFALTKGKISVHNPTLWRPIIDVRDVVEAYVRALESNLEITGVYNISEGNYTVGRIADIVKSTIEKETGKTVELDIQDRPDMRNYKVSNNKAKLELDFEAKYSPRDTVKSILENIDYIGMFDFDDKKYSNIEMFKELDL